MGIRARKLCRTAAWLLLLLIAAAVCTWKYFWALPDRALRFGFNNAPPYSFRGPDRQAAGLVVEIIEKAARRRGIRFEWKLIAGGPDRALQEKTIDIWPMLADIPGRRRYAHFSDPWIRNDYCLLSLKASQLSHMSGAAGQKVAYKENVVLETLMKRLMPEAIGMRFRSRKEAVRAVCRGEAKATLLEVRAAQFVLLERPSGCESAVFGQVLVDNGQVSVSVGSTFETAAAANMIRKEIGKLAREGSLGFILSKWSWLSAGETNVIYELTASQKHNAHGPETVKIHYPFHPLHGQIVRVRRRAKFPRGEYIYCELPDGTIAGFPSWITDATKSPDFTVGAPLTSAAALAELRKLLDSLHSNSQRGEVRGEGTNDTKENVADHADEPAVL